MQLQNYTIVIIEDDPQVNQIVRDIMASKYKRVVAYLDPVQAENELHLLSPDLVLLDLFLGSNNGLDILENLRNQGLIAPVIMMTAFSDIKMAIRAMKLGAEDFIIKPLDVEQLEISVEKALHNFDLRRRVNLLDEQLLREQPNEILGESEGMLKALEIAKIVARADTTVLILGESGTGKELFARYIHNHSSRARGPFVTLNCGAIPRELAENELFGYEKGAFTGATEKVRHGKFEQAQHGTIVLDEIAELSPELQVKLLRVLQERSFYRLGGAKEVSVDVRVIASTNKDIEKLVMEEKFREDLFYRLNVARIILPPLRERGADIIQLASSFINEFNQKFAKNITGFTPDAVELLQHYHWKGNIRELRNVIERVVLLETNDIVTKESINFLNSSILPCSTASVAINTPVELKKNQYKLQISDKGVQMADVLKDLIIQTLNITNGNTKKAAELLAVSSAKLKYRIEQLGINISGENIS